MSDSARPEEPAAAGAAEPQPERQMPSSQPVLLRALRWGIAATVVLIIVFGAIGWFVAAGPGLVGGVLGAAFSGLFLALTIGSITFANRFIHSDLFVPVFFGLVMGSWLVKFILFLVAALLLKDQSWLHPQIMFIAIIAGVIVSLVIDMLIVMKSRIPLLSGPGARG